MKKTYLSNNRNDISFGNVFWLEDKNGAAFKGDGFSYSLQSIFHPTKNRTEFVPLPNLHVIGQGFTEFKSYKRAAAFISRHCKATGMNYNAFNIKQGRRLLAPMHQVRSEMEHREEKAKQQAVTTPSLQTQKYSATPAMYRQRGMKAHALLLQCGWENPSLTLRNISTNPNRTIASHLSSYHRRKYAKELNEINA